MSCFHSTIAFFLRTTNSNLTWTNPSLIQTGSGYPYMNNLNQLVTLIVAKGNKPNTLCQDGNLANSGRRKRRGKLYIMTHIFYFGFIINMKYAFAIRRRLLLHLMERQCGACDNQSRITLQYGGQYDTARMECDTA